MRIGDFTALAFDVYGTLIDWESGIVEALRPLTDRLDPPPTRDAVLEAHAWHESAQQRLTPGRRYSELLATVHRRLAEEWGVPASWDDSLAYGRSVGDWPAFPDSGEALAYLKRHHRLFVLTNTDNASFERSAERLGVSFDGVFTAEDIGSYKPDPRNFEALITGLGRLGIAQGELLHVAESLFHDHVPANRFGLTSCWIHRRHGRQGFGATMDPGEMPRTDLRFTSMAALAEARRAEVGP